VHRIELAQSLCVIPLAQVPGLEDRVGDRASTEFAVGAANENIVVFASKHFGM
jgi:hypothetical protein